LKKRELVYREIVRQMNKKEPSAFDKLARSLPWLLRYPLWRAAESARRITEESGARRLIFVVANHFEPAWNGTREGLGVDAQLARLED